MFKNNFKNSNHILVCRNSKEDLNLDKTPKKYNLISR